MKSLMTTLKSHPAFNSAIVAWHRLSRNDQRALLLLAVVVVVAILYLGLWLPSQRGLEEARRQHAVQVELLEWMHANRHVVEGLAPRSNGGEASTESLLRLVSEVARAQDIALRRFEPDGTTGLRVWLEGVPFHAFAGWVEKLQVEHRITVSQVAVDSAGPGMVNVRAVLSR
ncbi:General secretion pathway M protein [Desulfurispirillum indicum S5]|uniref:General secretion pathway M protein n=1 Tax=Desulfurispirillum indicum (strain ATCC BAA-1389 / DSM 22839 / S5) TaxID=653733 RepID=E6W4U2_DESIS|nr:type II secretion system protein M [Desulfurispirillum indicum]ADU64820.1 General secretion pathway M protein [Desulfurispirillum indicum S5]